MLNISFKVGQKIFIGTGCVIQLQFISGDLSYASFDIVYPGGRLERCLKVLEFISLSNQTVAHIKNITSSSVSLAFDAPRDVKIEGEWSKGKENKGNQALTLTQLSLHDLVVYAKAKRPTDLELELVKRIEMILDT